MLGKAVCRCCAPLLVDQTATAAPLPPDELGSPATTLVIGLIGTGPNRGGPQHFEKLLAEAAPCGVALRHFTLGENLDPLWDTVLDGLIVAGAEPRAASMPDEPLWPDLARLVDWAGESTSGAIWSCFAAHAAVYRMDGITRERLPRKLSGVFGCANLGLGLLAGLPAQLQVPHSRYNTLSEDALLDSGYTILSRVAGAGSDAFCKPHLNSQFLFLQGHGEYGPRTLAGEYARDINRFLAGARPYPRLPVNYFTSATEAALSDMRRRLIRHPSNAAFTAFDWASVQCLDHDWHNPARKLYMAWLNCLAARKALPQ